MFLFKNKLYEFFRKKSRHLQNIKMVGVVEVESTIPIKDQFYRLAQQTTELPHTQKKSQYFNWLFYRLNF